MFKYQDPHLTKKELFIYGLLIITPLLFLVFSGFFQFSSQLNEKLLLFIFASCMTIFSYKAYKKMNSANISPTPKVDLPSTERTEIIRPNRIVARTKIAFIVLSVFSLWTLLDLFYYLYKSV